MTNTKIIETLRGVTFELNNEKHQMVKRNYTLNPVRIFSLIIDAYDKLCEVIKDIEEMEKVRVESAAPGIDRFIMKAIILSITPNSNGCEIYWRYDGVVYNTNVQRWFLELDSNKRLYSLLFRETQKQIENKNKELNNDY